MKFLSKQNLQPTGVRVPVPKKKDRKADVLEKLPGLFKMLIESVTNRPAPKVENRIEVSPNPPTPINVAPEVIVEAQNSKPVSWAFEIERERMGRIVRIVAKPIMGNE